MRSVLERLESRLEKNDAGCWIWNGSVSHRYGTIYAWGRYRRAHRVAFELYRQPIPNGMFVLHRCDVTRCCNPDHLFLGTQKDNIQDCVSKHRSRFSKMDVCKWGHPFSGEHLYLYTHPDGRQTRMCRTCYKRRSKERRARLKCA